MLAAHSTAMSTAYPLPDASKVRSMLGLLFEGLEVRVGKSFAVVPASGCWVALYIGDGGAAVGACIVDAALAANASAALSMLPLGIAKEAAASKLLTDAMVDNLREVLNICTRLLMSEGSPHLRLADIHRCNALPPNVAALLGAYKGRIDFELNVPKYGPGNLAVIST